MAAPGLVQTKTLRYRDRFEPIDALIFRFEAGLMTFALLAMSVTYFLKIIFEAVIAERNFVDAFLIRWLHGVQTQPPEALVQAVQSVYSPTIVAVVLLSTGLGAARAIEVRKFRERADDSGKPGRDAQGPGWSGRTFAVAAAIVLGCIALAAIVVNVHSGLLCGVLYLVSLVLFGTRAKRNGDVVLFAVMWALLSIPVAILLMAIPGQYAWVNDLSKILIMYVGFIGASMASRERKHIVLNFGRRLWPEASKHRVEALSLFVWLFFNVLLCVLAFHLFELQYSAGSTLSILSIPEFNIILPVVISFALMSLRVAVDLVRVLRGTESYFVGPGGVPLSDEPDVVAPAEPGGEAAA